MKKNKKKTKTESLSLFFLGTGVICRGVGPLATPRLTHLPRRDGATARAFSARARHRRAIGRRARRRRRALNGAGREAWRRDALDPHGRLRTALPEERPAKTRQQETNKSKTKKKALLSFYERRRDRATGAVFTTAPYRVGPVDRPTYTARVTRYAAQQTPPDAVQNSTKKKNKKKHAEKRLNT